ncbi:MAG: zinc-ribbon domain-containing protein [bacterium]|nr:MAG: zinc-ribbon domain-containing protein [bacterium]
MNDSRRNFPGGNSDDSRNLAQCPSCGKYYRIHPEKLPKGVRSFNCRSCGSLIPIAISREHPRSDDMIPVVLVAVPEEDLAELVVRILARNGFRGVVASTGRDAVRILTEDPPDAALINVVLPDILGYEIIDRVPGGPAERTFPIVLLSSVHHGTRYKRAPTSYYGADDYIERHHLPDLLVPKIKRLLDDGPRDGPLKAGPEVTAAQSDDDVDDRRKIEEIHLEGGDRSGDPGVEELRRMCRIIAGDIALYNEEIIRDSASAQLLDSLSSDLDEGVRLLRDRYPDFNGDHSLFLKEEMARILNSRRSPGKAG